MLPGSMVIKKP